MDGLREDLLSDACADSAILGRAEASRGYCLRCAAPYGARDRARSRRPARPGRTAATVLVAGLLLLGAAAAEAQTSRILVSNTAQTADDSANTSGNKHAQLFHTGANTAGYTLTGVVVASDDTSDDDFDVEVCEADTTANEFPTTTCTALTAPASFAGLGHVPFTHATGLALSANTNYVVVITQRGTESVELDSTTSSGEDTSLGLSDWSIKNKFYWQSGSTWMLKSGANEALRIIVNGYANTVVPTCSVASMSNRIWTGNLTAAQQTSGSTTFGYGSGFGTLDDTTFTYKGTQYTISTISVAASAILNMGLSSGLGTDANDLILHVGTEQFPFADALYNAALFAYSWVGSPPTWADGTAVCLALTEVVDPPEVSSVALTSAPGADNTYAIGDAVEATVTFDAAVDITGNPQLELDFDGTAKAAGCTVATNTTTMACSYTVAVGDSAPNGVAVAANKLTGGTITATGSTTITADLDHDAVMIDADHKVDGIRPTLVTTGSDAPTTSTDGETVLLVFSEDISAADRTKITIQANSVTVSTTMASMAGTKVELTLTTALTASATNLTVELAADAVDDAAGNGNLAAAAATVTNAVTPTPPGRPAAPSVSSVAGSTTSLSVTWTAPSNTGPTIDDYDLQYRQGTSGNFTDGPLEQTGTSATITGLTANTLYQVQVRATNSDGNGPWSPSGSGQTNSAGNSAPTFSSSTATRSVAENSGGDTDVGNPVTAADTDGGDMLTYTLEGADATSFTIVSTSGQIRTRSGVTYDYETTPSYTVIVKADDNNGGTDTVTVTIDLTNDTNEQPLEPAAPRVTATPNTTDSLTVSWSAPSNTGRPDIDSYDLQYREGTTGSWTGPQGESGTSATITGLTGDLTAYQVQVRATNADGAGPWSPSGRIRTTPPPPPVGPPSSPRNLTAMAGDQAVQLSWRRPVDDGGSRIVRYEYRQQEGDGPVGEWQIIGENPPPTNHTVTGLTNGVSYTFQVRAVNNGGWASPASESASTTPEPELAPFEVTIVGVPEVAVAGASYELTAQSDAEASLVYAWRVAYGGSIEPDDAQTVVWTAPEMAGVAWIRVDATREEDGAMAGQSAYVRVEVPAPPTTLALSHDAAPAEGAGTVTVTATLDNPAPADGLTVMLTTGGTATLGTDYTLSSTTITLAAGETAGTVTITITDDAEDDDGETIVLNAASTTPALTAESLTLTIEDNDVTPVPALPLLGQLLLALGLGAAGARVTRSRQARRRR